MNSRTALFLILFLALIPTSAAHGSPACTALFAKEGHVREFTALTPREQRAQLISQLKRQNIPAFIKEGRNGPVPVILLHQGTGEKLGAFLSQSIGPQTLLQPNTPYSDHGMIRLGGFPVAGSESARFNLQADWAMPETRAWFPGDKAEIHGSGIAWRNLDARMADAAQRGSYSRVTLEVAFVMNARDRASVEYYHRVRRATLFAISSENPSGQLRPSVPNTAHFYEGCFPFCSGTSIPTIEGTLQQRLRELGVADVEALLKSNAARRFVAGAKKLMLEADPFDAEKFNHGILMRNEGLTRALRELLPASLKNADPVKVENFANSVVSLHAARSVQRVFARHGITEDISGRGNIDNPNVAAILIYASPAEAPRFENATYTTSGVFPGTGWGLDEAGTVPYPDQVPLR